MSLVPDFLRPGKEEIIGEYTFTTENIIRFAEKFDPQYFHVDPEAAKNSLLGGHCASGWHTASAWMRLQRDYVSRHARRLELEGEVVPVFGPSPGFKDLKWMRPVFAGETIIYSNKNVSIRKSRSRAGWWIIEVLSTGKTTDGKPVISFVSFALVSIPAN